MTLLLLPGFVLLFVVGVVLLIKGSETAGIIVLAISAVALLANIAFALMIMSSDM